MSEYSAAGKEVQDQVLATVKQGQAAVVEAIEAWASTVKSITPDLPGLNAPLAEKLPKPEEFVGLGYDFAEQLLSNQRKFAEEVLKATAQLFSAQKSAK